MPYFDRFDICEAYYLYATLYHSGQFSRAYRVFGRLEKIQFRTNGFNDEYDLSENAREIFNRLVERNY